MTLPYSDAVFIQAFPRECTETFQEGHRALEFFGAVSYDNSRVAIGVDQEGFQQVLGVAERILRFKEMYND